MPKFNWCKFAEDKFGTRARYHNDKFHMSGTIPVGTKVRRTIGKGPKCTLGAVTYRRRPGNGSYGSVVGKIYQDKYNYPDVTGLENNCPIPYKTNFATAIDYWQNVLTDDEKKEYDRRASMGLRMSGYNLFLREALTGVYHMYVDRGDPADYDFAKEDLTTDGAWHDLDLSDIVPKIARAVLLVGLVKGNALDWEIQFKKYGQTNDINHGGMETMWPDVDRCRLMIVAMDNNQKVQYKADDKAWATLDIAVRGWWT